MPPFHPISITLLLKLTVAKLLRFFYLSLFFFTPLLFTSFNSELFEIPKMYFIYLSTILIVSLHLFRWLKGLTPLFPRHKFFLFLLAFLFFQTLSTLLSVNPYTSFFGYYSRLNGGLLSLICFTLLSLILPLYLDDKFRQKIINFSLYSGIIVSIYAVLEHFGIDKNMWVQDVQSRVFSTLGQPNWLAAYLCILLPLSVDKLLKSSPRSFRFYLSLFPPVLFYLALLYTKSKSGLIAALLSLALYFGISFFRHLLPKKTIVVILLFLALTLTVNNPLKDYLFPSPPTPETSQNETINITPSSDIRKIVWQGSLLLWRRFPLLGTGPETFAYTYYWVRPASHNLTSEWDFLYNKAHNEYLNYLATTGTLGLLTYLLFILASLYFMRKNIPILSAFISILITNFAGFSVALVSLYFFLLPLLALPNFSQNPTRKKAPLPLFLLLIFLSFYFLRQIASFYLADVAYAQSQSLYQQQKYSTAQSYIQTATQLRPHEALYHSLASQIAAGLLLPDLAISQSNLALQLSPLDTNLWKERAQVFSQLSLQDPKYFSTAIDALLQDTKLAPTDAKTYYLLGIFLQAAKQDSQATTYFLKAVELKPNYDHALFALGKIYFEKKNYPEAKKYFEQTLLYAPNNQDAKNYLDKITSL